MLNIQTLASGSTGNAYVLSNGTSSLLLEAGIPTKQLRQQSGFRLTGLDGALITHEHGDHAAAVPYIMQMGVDTYMSAGTAAGIGTLSHRLHHIQALEQFRVGPWTILPFDLVHDAQEPLGFLLTDQVNKILYATDTRYLKYCFRGVTHWMIECNHSREILSDSVIQGHMHPALAERVRWNHMSLETVQRLLAVNDLSRTEEVHLLHLSDDNSDEEGFVQAIEGQTGVPTYAE